MVPLIILQLVPLVANDTSGDHKTLASAIGTNGDIGGTIGANGTIGRSTADSNSAFDNHFNEI